MVYLRRIKVRDHLQRHRRFKRYKEGSGSIRLCSHSSWSFPPLVGRGKGGTTFTGDLLRDGARSVAAGLDRNCGEREKQAIPEPKPEVEVGTGAANVRFLSPPLL